MRHKELGSVSTFKIAAAYIGTIVGAGFATGQEVMQFFLKFGASGIVGIGLATLLFILFGILIMELGMSLNADSHIKIIRHSSGKYLSVFIDAIITFFLFGALSAMIAGAGALFEQQFILPSIIGNIIMAALTALTVLTGFKGVLNAISLVVPFLLISVLGMSIYSIVTSPPAIGETSVLNDGGGLIGNFFFAAILYVSYNTIISIAVLGPLGIEAGERKKIRIGAILGGLGLGLGSVLIYLALAGNVESVRYLEVPMIFIAGRISNIIVILFAVVLIAEIYTTAVGSLYGFVKRISDSEFIKNRPDRRRIENLIVIVATALALLSSRLGFLNLVKYLYPVIGYAGLTLLVSLIIKRVKSRQQT